MAEKLAAKKAAMSEAEIQAVIENTARLKLRQQTPDYQEALATIPLLKIEDINPEPKHIPLEERQLDGVKVLYTPAETNGIVYLNLYFRADVIPQELVPYAYLFSDIIGLVDTESSTYEDMTNRVNMHTGGITFSLENLTLEGVADSLQPLFRVSAKAFMRKLPELAEIIGELLNETKFDDKKRLLELMQDRKSVV